MLCQTIELTKTWKNVRLHIVRPELPKNTYKTALKMMHIGCFEDGPAVFPLRIGRWRVWPAAQPRPSAI